MGYRTAAERLWSGDHGADWTERSWNDDILASKIAMYTSVLRRTDGIRSVLEYGPNKGQSLCAIKTLLPEARCCGVEINPTAAQALKDNLPFCEVITGSLLEVKLEEQYDLVSTCGMLIHISPEYIQQAYQAVYDTCRRYIAIAEYYNPTPVDVPYRGETGVLFKRDFAGELMDRYKDLTLVDYSFVYHRDQQFPADDINWFLLKKEQTNI